MALVAGSSTFDVTMQVKLLVDRAGDLKKDYRDVVVWLVPIGTLHLRSLDAEGSPICIVQRNKMFEPHLMVVPVGQVVEFCNRDAWVHFPFAFSNGLPVSFKPRQPDGRKAMKFDHTGVTYLFCEIHPQMNAVILAVDSPYFGVSDKWGRLSIRNVPAGTYSVHVWYEYAAPRVLRRVVELPPENCRRPVLSISIVRRTESATENHPQRSSVRGTP